MNTQLLKKTNHLSDILRDSLVLPWGIVAFLLLAPSSVFAKEHITHTRTRLMNPIDLPTAASAAGEDMYLYEENARTYLTLNRIGGKHLLVMAVTDPKKLSIAAETQWLSIFPMTSLARWEVNRIDSFPYYKRSSA